MNRTNQIAPVSRTPSRATERARAETSVIRGSVLSSSSFDAVDNAALETPSDEHSFDTDEHVNVDDGDDVDDARSTPETVEETQLRTVLRCTPRTRLRRRRKATSRGDEVSLEENTDPRANETNPTKKPTGETVTCGLSKNVDFITREDWPREVDIKA